jgi:TPR repeat protein
MKSCHLAALIVCLTPVAGAQPASAPRSWYYCEPARAYYPYVQTCPVPWREVEPARQVAPSAARTPEMPMKSVETDNPGAFEQGLGDREDWERWLAGLEGPYHEGAFWWSANRSVSGHPSCIEGQRAAGASADWLDGCQTAKTKLDPSDSLRKAGSAYRKGWNSYHTEAAQKSEIQPLQTSATGQLRDGQAAYRRGDYATAFRLLRPSAEQGNADAELSLGFMYGTGQGVAKDDAEAMNWYRKAADQGNAVAQSNLGFMYEKGDGVAQDYAKAATLYRKAADQGLAIGQSNLGNSYEFGQGVPEDYAEAVIWYRKAAAQGDAKAKNGLTSLYARFPILLQLLDN